MKSKISNLIFLLLFIILLSLFIFSLYHIIIWKNNNKKNKEINEMLHEYIIQGGNDKYNIDFEKLKKLNNDTIAYIKVNNTNIDYIVVKGKDNEYYLNHNFNEENNTSGWIFADKNNKFNGEDKNIVIYGHNTRDKSMFGSLRNVLDETWYEDINNHTVILVTEKGLKKYKVFSTYKIDNEDYYIRTEFNSDEEYLKFLTIIKNRSVYDYNVDLDENDKILTLSTCSNNGKKRVVLHAKVID